MIEAVFADKAGQTPQDVERRRKMAAALMEGGQRGRAPQSGLELAGRLAMTLMGQYQDAKAEKQDTANRSSANQLLADTLLGGAFPESVAVGGSPTAPAATGVPSGAPSAQASAIKAGLVARGLPDHIADGFVMNFQDESGLNPGINEQNPTVPGSRGGYGLYQLTGPRRRAFESYAQQRGVNPSDVDAQLDFLVSELKGPEAGAAKSIFAAPDAGSAAAAIATNFLRPAKQHLDARVAKYTSGAPVQVASLDPSVGMGQPQPSNYPEQGKVAPVDWTDQQNLSAAPGMQFAGGQGGIMAQPIPGQAPQQANPNQAVSDELLRKNDMALGGAMAPPGTPQLQGATLGGAFPSAPMINGTESLTPQPDYMDNAPQFPAAPGQPDRRAMIAQLLGNPYTAEAGQQLLMQEYKRQQEANDPANQLDMEYKRAQLAALKAKDDGADYKVVDKRLIKTTKDGTVTDVTPEAPNAKPGQFRFEGTSVEAQALNGLMDSGTLTPDQAQQLAAGKTITDPQTGAIVFLTPRGIFSQPAEGGPAMPVDTPQGAPASPATPPAGQSGAQPATGGNPGIIPLTEGKPGKLATEGERRNRSLYSVVQPELKVVEDNYAALSDPKNQLYSRLPLSEYMTTKEYQQAANSLQTIVSSYLYSVSGATATPDEVKKQTDILTPRPGEKKESIENKLRRVRTMVDAIRQSGGNWVPPAEAQMPDGVDPEIWDVMTPEEKALFQ